MAKNNIDLRIKMMEAGVSQAQIAKVLEIRRDYLCRVMASGRMTEDFRQRILSAIKTLEESA